MAVNMARKYGSRLHVLHLSTAREMELFRNDIPLDRKRITSEVCIHHLWFSDADYALYGSRIKWNPAIKTAYDREGLWKALLEDRIDVVATDHAPHTLEEKSQGYFKCPSGGPLVQHYLLAMLHFYHSGKISLEKIVEKMCHAPAICYGVDKRGFTRESYHADLMLVDPDAETSVTASNLYYKCNWSPFEGLTFNSGITHTFVNGTLVYEAIPNLLNGNFNEDHRGERLLFNR